MWLLPPYFRALGGRRGAFFRQTRRFPARRYYTLVFFILNIWIPRIVVPLARKTGFGTTKSGFGSPFGSKNRVWDYKTCGSAVHSAVQNELITNSRRNSRRRREFSLKFGLKRHEFQAKLQAAPRIQPEVWAKTGLSPGKTSGGA